METRDIHERIESLSTDDGTRIGYRCLGEGPVVVIVPGGMMTSRQYLPLGALLASAHTIVVMDRRGHGLSGPISQPHGMEQEVKDLTCLLEHVGADRVFGHSAGGVIALQTALRRPIARLAVFEPPVLINDLLPVAWLPAFEAALKQGRRLSAMALFQQGMRMNWVSRIPRPLLDAFLWVMLRGEDGREAFDLLPTLPIDFQLLPAMADRREYAQLRAETLILGGLRSPDYLLEAVNRLAEAIPGSTLHMAPDLDHSAPTSLGEAFERESIARELLSWFA